MTYNVFGGTLNLTQSINHDVVDGVGSGGDGDDDDVMMIVTVFVADRKLLSLPVTFTSLITVTRSNAVFFRTTLIPR